mgnify:CR=1 FL=1
MKECEGDKIRKAERISQADKITDELRRITKMDDLNDCYGQALQREMQEANRLEHELIEAGNREAEAYYAEMAGLEEQAMIDAEQGD